LKKVGNEKNEESKMTKTNKIILYSLLLVLLTSFFCVGEKTAEEEEKEPVKPKVYQIQKGPASAVGAGKAVGPVGGVAKAYSEKQKEIDDVWIKIGVLLKIPEALKNLVWDPFSGWIAYNQYYKEKIGEVSEGVIAEAISFEGCEITTSVDTKAVGKPWEGSLISGVDSATDSFVNRCAEKYNTVNGKTEKVCFGTVELIQMLELTSCALNKLYGVKLYVKDRSFQTGGIIYKNKQSAQEMPPTNFYELATKTEKYKYAKHTTHQNGLDADIGYFFVEEGSLKNKISSEEGCGSKTCSHEASEMFKNQRVLEANWNLLKIMDMVFPLSYVAFDKYLIWELHNYACEHDSGSLDEIERFFGKGCNEIPQTVGSSSYSKSWGGILKHVDGHADHFHVTIKCPKGDGGCNYKKANREIKGVKVEMQAAEETAPTPTVSGLTQVTSEVPSGVKFYTYTTGCESKVEKKIGRKEGIIVPDGVGSNPEVYFYFHGHSLSSVNSYVKSKKLLDKVAEIKQNGKDIVLVWFKGGDKHISTDKIIKTGPYEGQPGSGGSNWMKGKRSETSDSQFKCFYDEAISKLKSLNLNPQSMSFMVHSNGGRTVRDVLKGPFLDESHLPINSIIYFDACYGSWCEDVAEISSSKRGHIYAYYQGTGDTKEGSEEIEWMDQVTVKTTTVAHGAVPKQCFLDHHVDDNCMA